MTDIDDRSIADVRRKMLSPKRIAIQILGFLIGLAFVIYLVKLAFYGEADWSRIREASPWLIAGLLLTGLLGMALGSLLVQRSRSPQGILCNFVLLACHCVH